MKRSFKYRYICTRRKTEADVWKFIDVFLRSGQPRKPDEIPVEELDIHLARLFMNAKKASGENYELDTLMSI